MQHKMNHDAYDSPTFTTKKGISAWFAQDKNCEQGRGQIDGREIQNMLDFPLSLSEQAIINPDIA